MAKNIYRSALRSKRLLREAFVELLREKDYARITVTELVERADLNRSTFYAHYNDISNLMSELVAEVSDGLFQVLQSAVNSDFLHHPETTLEMLGKLLDGERRLYRSIGASQQSNAFMDEMQHVVAKRMQEELGRTPGFDPTGLTAFLSGGIVTLYRLWLDGGMGNVGVEEVNRLAAIYVKAVGNVLG